MFECVIASFFTILVYLFYMEKSTDFPIPPVFFKDEKTNMIFVYSVEDYCRIKKETHNPFGCVLFFICISFLLEFVSDTATEVCMTKWLFMLFFDRSFVPAHRISVWDLPNCADDGHSWV